jgi:hypothetical protein
MRSIFTLWSSARGAIAKNADAADQRAAVVLLLDHLCW